MTCKQAVLLAAGSGKRLLPYTADRPKCLVAVDGRPLVDGLVESIAAIGVEELVVVTGYRAGALRAHLGRRCAGIAVTYVDNPDHATTNNIYSLHLARPAIRAPFLLLESDVHAEPAVVAAIDEPDRIAVAAYHELMSGTGVRFAPDGAVTEVVLAAHRGDRRGVYKTVNFSSFSSAVWSVYSDRLDRWIAAGRLGDYYEAVLAELVNTRAVAMTAVDVTALRWHEIDDAADLQRAQGTLSPWSTDARGAPNDLSARWLRSG